MERNTEEDKNYGYNINTMVSIPIKIKKLGQFMAMKEDISFSKFVTDLIVDYGKGFYAESNSGWRKEIVNIFEGSDEHESPFREEK